MTSPFSSSAGRLNYMTIRRGLVLFWALWTSLVTLTNLFDAMKELTILGPDWTFASNNFDLLAATVGAHGVPLSWAVGLFGGIIAWQLAASWLFWRAWLVMGTRGRGRSPEVTQAFAVSLALWAAFLLGTEATVSYATAPTHMGALIAQIATLLVLRTGSSEEMRSS